MAPLGGEREMRHDGSQLAVVLEERKVWSKRWKTKVARFRVLSTFDLAVGASPVP